MMRKRQEPSPKGAKKTPPDKGALVRKLRWHGREEEAKKLWNQLPEEEKTSSTVPEHLFTD